MFIRYKVQTGRALPCKAAVIICRHHRLAYGNLPTPKVLDSTLISPITLHLEYMALYEEFLRLGQDRVSYHSERKEKGGQRMQHAKADHVTLMPRRMFRFNTNKFVMPEVQDTYAFLGLNLVPDATSNEIHT